MCCRTARQPGSGMVLCPHLTAIWCSDFDPCFRVGGCNSWHDLARYSFDSQDLHKFPMVNAWMVSTAFRQQWTSGHSMVKLVPQFYHQCNHRSFMPEPILWVSEQWIKCWSLSVHDQAIVQFHDCREAYSSVLYEVTILMDCDYD